MKDLKLLRLTIVFALLSKHSEGASALRDSSNHKTNGEDFFSYFIREAPLHSADYQTGVSVSDIPWLNKDLMERAAHYYRKNFIGISLSHFYALVEVIALKSTTSVLLSTGGFHNHTLAGDRLTKTVFHIREWCRSGFKIMDPSSVASKSIRTIRQRHRSAEYIFKESNLYSQINKYERIGKHKALVEAIHADLAHVDTRDAPVHLLQWNSTAAVGQFDLAVVQFLFYCHSTLIPEGYGLRRTSKDDRLAFIHLWAVFGRLLGIQDRFNVALNLRQDRQKHFYNNIVVASLKNIDETVLSLMSNTMDGWYATFLVPTVLRLKCWLFYAMSRSIDGFTGYNIRRLMDLEDEVCLLYITGTVSGLNELKLSNHLGILTFNSWFEKELERIGLGNTLNL